MSWCTTELLGFWWLCVECWALWVESGFVVGDCQFGDLFADFCWECWGLCVMFGFVGFGVWIWFWVLDGLGPSG